jgi:hypothetical protein
MENKNTAPTWSAVFGVLAILLIFLGTLFFIGGMIFPKADIVAIGLGLELQIIGFAIIIYQRK